MEKIADGVVYDHKENGKQYVVSHQGKMLNDSHWVHATTYYPYGFPDEVYTRTSESFKEKFVISKLY